MKLQSSWRSLGSRKIPKEQMEELKGMTEREDGIIAEYNLTAMPGKLKWMQKLIKRFRYIAGLPDHGSKVMISKDRIVTKVW